MSRNLLLFFLLALGFLPARAQQDSLEITNEDSTVLAPVPGAADGLPGQDSLLLRGYINTLCSRSFAGRGYTGRGMNKAAGYIVTQFGQLGLKPFPDGFLQYYSYPVNVFPGIVDIKINERTLKAGEEYLIHPASQGSSVEALKLAVIDGHEFAGKLSGKLKKPGAVEKAWQKWLKNISRRKYAYLLKNTDTIAKIMQWQGGEELLRRLPAGIFFILKKGKPTWSVARDQMAATVVELYDSSLVFQKNRKITATIQNQFQEQFKAANIIGYVPGTEHADSFIVLSAHYDHLGKMGSRTMFPGASDNASGTAMLLNLAHYYAKHPQRYSIAFIAFSGEEAGLLGSGYYTQHPSFPLQQIRFLVNLDILGDASQGITVVNGSLHPEAFEKLVLLNTEGKFLPEVRVRGKAANSDHYHFTEMGVPAFFIYTNGGKGYYHDIWDKADKVTLNNIPALAALLKQFIAAVQ